MLWVVMVVMVVVMVYIWYGDGLHVVGCTYYICSKRTSLSLKPTRANLYYQNSMYVLNQSRRRCLCRFN